MPAHSTLDVVLKSMLMKLERSDKYWRFERIFVVSCKEYE